MAEKNQNKSRKMRADKFTWKPGDVKIYKNEAEWKKANKDKKKK